MKYTLYCPLSKTTVEDNYTLHYVEGSLLKSVYSEKLNVRSEHSGMLKFKDWLPFTGNPNQIVGTLTYQSSKLNEILNMPNLWITFHGYWPEKNGLCPTGSFKDLEAIPTIMRMKEKGCKGLICASAGNTARAFSYFCGLENIPLIIVISKKHLHRIHLPKNHPIENTKVIVIEDGDYSDAKMVAKKLSKVLEGWQLEGGIHNIARRDGIGSLILEATYKIGKLPQHYFQGISGGPGPVGVHEMANRLIEANLFEGPVPRQHVSQNEEVCPIHKAWQAKRDHLVDSDSPVENVSVFSDYLLNKSPAYSIQGGVFNMLSESNGQTYAISKTQAIEAKRIFETTEEIDIMSPGAIAFASLLQALKNNDIHTNDLTVVNISGGGIQRLKQDFEMIEMIPWKTVSKRDKIENFSSLLTINDEF
jgi:cysteate synthase